MGGVNISSFILTNVEARFLEHLLGFGEGDANRFVAGWKLEVASVGVAGVSHDIGEADAVFAGLQLPNYKSHQPFAERKRFMVMVADRHLVVEACELDFDQLQIRTMRWSVQTSVRCLLVFEFSALKTGPIEKTLLISPAIAHCLKNWGLWVRYAFFSK